MTFTFTVKPPRQNVTWPSHVFPCCDLLCECSFFCYAEGRFLHSFLPLGLPVAQMVKKSACNAGDPGLIPGSGRSSGEGNGNPLQYSCLENPMNREAWWATVHGVAESDMTEQLTLSLFLPSSAVLLCIDHSFIFWHRKEGANNSALALGQNHL